MTDETAAKIVYHILAGLAGFAVFMLLAFAWDWGFVPRTTVSTGTITLSDGRILQTRKYRPTADIDRRGRLPHVPIDQRPFSEEVRLPSGRWIPCAKDCRAAAERAMR